MATHRARHGGRQVDAVVCWPHHRGGEAHCLARVDVPGSQAPPVVVVSEICSNPDDLGVVDDFAAVAVAVLTTVRSQVQIDPAAVVWLAHHGPFSYHDPAGPETFTHVPLRWDGERFHDDLADHRLLTSAEATEMLSGDVVLDPVSDVLDELGWEH
jgi:hypothetical protein